MKTKDFQWSRHHVCCDLSIKDTDTGKQLLVALEGYFGPEIELLKWLWFMVINLNHNSASMLLEIIIFPCLTQILSFLTLCVPALQLPGSSHACSVSINTKHLRGWRCLIVLFGQMPPDSRLHNSQHLSRRAAEGPRTPCVLCSTHLTHSVSP